MVFIRSARLSLPILFQRSSNALQGVPQQAAPHASSPGLTLPGNAPQVQATSHLYHDELLGHPVNKHTTGQAPRYIFAVVPSLVLIHAFRPPGDTDR